MKRPTKKEIREAVEGLKPKTETSPSMEQNTPRLQEKKANKQRIRKKGV